MRIRNQYILVLFAILFIHLAVNSQINREANPVFIERDFVLPASVGYVNDFEEIFTFEQIDKLEKIITEFEKNTTNEIAVITVKSIEPYDNIRDYATGISNHWGVGKSEKNNGLTIVVSCELKKVRISTGYGTEQILTDETCQGVIDEIMIPEFKDGNYYLGIEKGLLEIIKLWK